MPIHPKDVGTANPRLQCSVCGKWKRLRTKDDQPPFGLRQTFFGSCAHSGGGDHVAGDGRDVCARCCDTECRRLALSVSPAR